jgi:probable rRNA maturation factor
MGHASLVSPKPLSSVTIFDQQSDLPFSHQEVEGVVRAVLSHYKVVTDQVSLHFVDTKTICALHEEYFNDPSVTDCITFPIDEPGAPSPSILGEVFICPQTALTQDPTAPYEELTLYIVHTLLHLLGYDDQGAEEKLMREQERNCMEMLRMQKKILSNQPSVYT